MTGMTYVRNFRSYPMTGIRCVVRYETYLMTGMTYVRNFRLYLMKGIRCVVHYEPCLMTGLTYVIKLQIIPYDWNKMCGPLRTMPYDRYDLC